MAAATLAAAFLYVLLPMPRRSLSLPARPVLPATATGALHVHTNRSDGSGSPDDVAAAAARAGLQFVILTDHGDGTRVPDPPQYRSGVLVIDAVELSTSEGHYIAIGLPPTPYPLRGDARDVVDDVRRLGGFGIVAHPDSAKPGLRWRAWDVPFDAMEWLNADTEWRDERPLQLARALLRYPFRRVETLASLLDRPDATLSRWDALTRLRPIVALAGADAHARAGWRDDEENGYRRGRYLRLPSYEVSFRTFALRVPLDRAIGGDAPSDAARIITSMKAGQVYSAIDAIGSPAALDFTATAGTRIASPGASVESGGAVAFEARTNATAGGVIVLRKDGRILIQEPLPRLRYESTSGNGAYRIEVYLSGAPGNPPVPWIVSNPIYIQPPGWGVRPAVVEAAAREGLPIQGGPWHVEKDAGSQAEVSHPDPPSGPVEFHYSLAGGSSVGQYAALAVSVGSALRERARLVFRARASQPMRISVQARRPQSGERWQRSVYLDTTTRDVVVPFRELRAVGGAMAFNPGLVDTVLFVVDTTNTNPGGEGRVTLGDLRVE